MEDPDLSGPYRVVVEDDQVTMDAAARPGVDVERASGTIADAMADMGLKVIPRAVADLPTFFHRATRAIPSRDLGLWNALAEEQRRLEE
jgi:hypothetical protein